MKQTAILTIQASVEKANDGSYWCYTPASVRNCVLSGCGKTPQAAIDDMIDAYNEVKEMNEEEGISTPEVSFTFKYDIPSFFDNKMSKTSTVFNMTNKELYRKKPSCK